LIQLAIVVVIDGISYPDSVKRVSPPNTTIPNTLAALPSNQYATDLDVVSGKNLFLAVSSALSLAIRFSYCFSPCFPSFLPREDNGVALPNFPGSGNAAALLLKRIARDMFDFIGSWSLDGRGVRRAIFKY
jgi:hypothetical protein